MIEMFKQRFACTACGQRFYTREQLSTHWEAEPICRGSLNRPVGQFGARSAVHCVGCHSESDCLTHAYRGCPAC